MCRIQTHCREFQFVGMLASADKFDKDFAAVRVANSLRDGFSSTNVGASVGLAQELFEPL